MKLNFLEEQPQVFHEDFKPRRKWNPWIIGGGFMILLLVFFIVGLLAAGQVLAGALDGQDALESAQDNIWSLELEDAQQDFLDAEDAFEKANRSLIVFSPLRLLPWFNDQFKAVSAVLRAGEVSSEALSEILFVGSDVLRLAMEEDDLVDGWSNLDTETRTQILQRFHSSLSTFEIAQNEIKIISEDLNDDTNGTLIGFLEIQRDVASNKLETVERALGVVVQASALVPVVSGEDGGNILLLFLNNDELRPGGGFIGSFGIVQVEAGLVKDVTTYDVMAVDGPVLDTRVETPPEPLGEYLGVPAWFLRDANWSPDFVESTNQSIQYFNEELREAGDRAVIDPNIEFDAVVGVTTRFASDILSVVGDVRVDGEVFTKDNISDALANAVEFTFIDRGVDFEDRKAIIQDIVSEVHDRLETLSLDEWRKLFTHLGDRLEDKNVMLYSSREDVMKLFDRQGWTGRVDVEHVGDYLMVVDANMAALKTDPAVSRSVHYEIVPDGDGLMAKVSINYQHNKPFDPKTSRYRTYTRFYVPLGSEFVSAEGTLTADRLKNPQELPDEVVISEELGKTVFGMFTSVEPLSTHELIVKYKLPEDISKDVRHGDYELLVQKQLGAQNNTLTLDLDFGTKLRRATPGEEPGEWGDEIYHLNTILDQDRMFLIQL